LVFIPDQRNVPAPACLIDWDAVGKHVEADIIQTLTMDLSFIDFENERDQCFHACRLLRMECMPAVPSSIIGRILAIDKGLVKRQFKWVIAHPNRPSPNGRPSIRSQEQRNQFIEAISHAYATRVPWTIADVNAYIEEHFRVHLAKQTIHELLKLDARVKSCRRVPMEDGRTEVTFKEISDVFRRVIEIIDGVGSHFVFSMDETGHQDWADRAEQVCAVPSTRESDHVHLPVSHAGKRTTLMVYIAADGSAVTREIIIPRKTIADDLVLTGLTREKVIIRLHPKGYMNTQLFDDWFLHILFLALAHRRIIQA
jgi:hypothetical protein